METIKDESEEWNEAVSWFESIINASDNEKK